MAGRVALRATTRARDPSYLDSLILPHLGNKPLGSVQPSDLEAWIADLAAAGKAPATIQKAYQIASGVFRLAVRDRLIALSPAGASNSQGSNTPNRTPSPSTKSWHSPTQSTPAPRPHPRRCLRWASDRRARRSPNRRCRPAPQPDPRPQNSIRRSRPSDRRTTQDDQSIRTVVLPGTITDQVVEHITQLEETSPDAWLFPAPQGGPIRRTRVGCATSGNPHSKQPASTRTSVPTPPTLPSGAADRPRRAPEGHRRPSRTRIGTNRPRRLRSCLRRHRPKPPPENDFEAQMELPDPGGWELVKSPLRDSDAEPSIHCLL